jgi:putative solute:sodium symporter small subunit
MTLDMTLDRDTTGSTNGTRQSVYWRRTRRLTLKLLAVWFAATFGTIYFARELSELTLFGWPISFYMAAQGTTLIYLLVVGLYAWRMRQLDKTINRDQSDAR